MLVCRLRFGGQQIRQHTQMLKYGLKLKNDTLTPVEVTSIIAQPAVLQSIACSCESSSSCANERCRCFAVDFCAFHIVNVVYDICTNKCTESLTPVDVHDDTSYEFRVHTRALRWSAFLPHYRFRCQNPFRLGLYNVIILKIMTDSLHF